MRRAIDEVSIESGSEGKRARNPVDVNLILDRELRVGVVRGLRRRSSDGIGRETRPVGPHFASGNWLGMTGPSRTLFELPDKASLGELLVLTASSQALAIAYKKHHQLRT